MKMDIRYCGRAIGSVIDSVLVCALCSQRVNNSHHFASRSEFTSHMYVRHNDTLKVLEDSAPKAFWTCGTPCWSWPQGVAA